LGPRKGKNRQISIDWDAELPATANYPDSRRLQRIRVTVDGHCVGGVFVSTTGFAESVLNLDETWKAVVQNAAENSVRRTDPLVTFTQNPGPEDHFLYSQSGTWVHRSLPQLGAS